MKSLAKFLMMTKQRSLFIQRFFKKGQGPCLFQLIWMSSSYLDALSQLGHQAAIRRKRSAFHGWAVVKASSVREEGRTLCFGPYYRASGTSRQSLSCGNSFEHLARQRRSINQERMETTYKGTCRRLRICSFASPRRDSVSHTLPL